MPLSLNNITKTIDNRTILNDVSFEVGDGEIFGIFGPTSSGKSALLSVVAGKKQADGGAVSYNGQDISQLSADDRPCSMPVPNTESVWRTLFRTERPSSIADGEVQFVAFRTAVDKAPGILLLDNSFCDMDSRLRQTAFDGMRRAAGERGLAVVFATSDYEEVLLACDRVGVLIDGKLRQVGIPADVYESPADAAVAAVIGRVNLFAARRLTSSKAEIPEYQTVDGEHRLYTRKIERTGLAPINQPVTLGIRPEHVSISFGASFPEDNIIRATLERVKFLGPYTLVEFDAGGLKIEAMVPRLVGLSVGEECMVGLPPERLMIFKD